MDRFKKVVLGSQGLRVSVEGLARMGMTDFPGGTLYGTTDETESIATIHRALELGVTMLDTADLYGPFTNEQLVGKAIAGKRSQVTIATKFGFGVNDAGTVTFAYNGHPAYVRKSIERSLTNLRAAYIDLYYLHRMAPIHP